MDVEMLDENILPSIVGGEIKIIHENWHLEYSACFILCPVTKPYVPQSVSIVSSKEDPVVSNQLPVHNYMNGTGTSEVKTDIKSVGVCVQPVHFNYDKILELLEFIELNKILGVTKFTLYNHTISPDVSCILEQYVIEGSVEVLPWELNIESKTEIRIEGIFAAFNDCLYRNMNDFQYLMLIDFDEFIIPHITETLPQMLSYIDSSPKVQGRVTSSYIFQNAFFYRQFPDDDQAESILRVLRKTQRKSKFHPPSVRSKYICVARNINEVGNHFIWEFSHGNRFNVPTEYGYLHHYRTCEFGGDDCINTESVVDRTMFKYRHLLVQTIKHRVRKLYLDDKCPLEWLHHNLSLYEE